MKLKEVAKNHGLTPQGVDYALRQYQIVINEITHGMMSKLSYDAHDIIRMAQERWCDTCELKEQEAVKPREQEETHTWTVCGNCSQHLISKWLWCPYCGRKVKWN